MYRMCNPPASFYSTRRQVLSYSSPGQRHIRPFLRVLVVGGGEGFNAGGKFEDLDVGGAVGPVVMPADDYVAAG